MLTATASSQRARPLTPASIGGRGRRRTDASRAESLVTPPGCIPSRGTSIPAPWSTVLSHIPAGSYATAERGE